VALSFAGKVLTGEGKGRGGQWVVELEWLVAYPPTTTKQVGLFVATNAKGGGGRTPAPALKVEPHLLGERRGKKYFSPVLETSSVQIPGNMSTIMQRAVASPMAKAAARAMSYDSTRGALMVCRRPLPLSPIRWYMTSSIREGHAAVVRVCLVPPSLLTPPLPPRPAAHRA
jgi:hypothetical protein